MYVKRSGGPDRWRVITISAGGRHSLVLALPDNGDLLQYDLDASRISAAGRASQSSLYPPDFLAAPSRPRSEADMPLAPEIPRGGARTQTRLLSDKIKVGFQV